MHAQHHEYKIPNTPLAGIYGDTLESALIAHFAFWPVLVFPTSYGALAIFAFIISFAVQLNHSGRRIEIPYLYTTRFHLAHHALRRCNFAEHTCVWDWLFGTLHIPVSYESLWADTVIKPRLT